MARFCPHCKRIGLDEAQCCDDKTLPLERSEFHTLALTVLGFAALLALAAGQLPVAAAAFALAAALALRAPLVSDLPDLQVDSETPAELVRGLLDRCRLPKCATVAVLRDADPAAAAAVLEALRAGKLPALGNLRLAGVAGVLPLPLHLAPALKHLSLAGCGGVDDAGAALLAEALRGAPQLRGLYLTACAGLSGEGAAALAGALSHLPELRSLKLCGTRPIADAEGRVEPLVSALRHVPLLVELNVNGAGVTAAGLGELIEEAARVAPKLTDLAAAPVRGPVEQKWREWAATVMPHCFLELSGSQ